MAIVTHQSDGELGSWTLLEWRPRHLAHTIERVWHFEGMTAHPRERVMPNGLLELIVHLGPRYHVVRDDRTERCAVTGISGLQVTPLLVEAPRERTTLVGVQLTPSGAYALLGQPLHELTGLDVDFADVIGPAAPELADRCARASTPKESLQAAAGWIVQRLAAGRSLDPQVAWIAGSIRARRGAVSIGGLRERTGLTKSRLADAFREQIGVTPKVYARIHRFSHAIARMQQREEPMSELALAAGYFDQPHLAGEFKRLSGLTPGEYQAAVQYQTGVNVAER